MRRQANEDLKTSQENLQVESLEDWVRDTFASLPQPCDVANHCSERCIDRLDGSLWQEADQLRCTVLEWKSSGGELRGLVKGVLGEVQSLSQRIGDLSGSFNTRLGGVEASLKRHAQELEQLRAAEHRVACARAEDASSHRAQVNAISQSVKELAQHFKEFQASGAAHGSGCTGGCALHADTGGHDLDVRAQLASVSHQVAGLARSVESDLDVLRRRFQSAPGNIESATVLMNRTGRSPGTEREGCTNGDQSPGSERAGAMEAMEMASQATEGIARVEERMEVLAERMGHAMHRLGSGEQAAEAVRSQLSELREDVRRQVVSLREDFEAQMQSWISRITPTNRDQHYQLHHASSDGSSPISVESTTQWPTSLIEDGNDCLTCGEESACGPQVWKVNGDESRGLEPLDLCVKESIPSMKLEGTVGN